MLGHCRLLASTRADLSKLCNRVSSKACLRPLRWSVSISASQSAIHSTESAGTGSEKPLQLQCSRLAVAGQGLCHTASGEQFLVDRCLPGEILTVELKKSKKGPSAAEKLQQIQASADEIEPPCAHFNSGCGGCCSQNLAYAAQLTQKQLQIEDNFCQPAGLSLPSTLIQRIAPCSQPFGYRNKMVFTSSSQGFGLYHYASGNGLVPVTDCHLQDSTANSLLQQAQHLHLHTFTEALTIRWAALSPEGPRQYMVISHIRAAAKLWKKKREAVTARLLKVARVLMTQQPALVSFVARQGPTRHDCLTSAAGEYVIAGQDHLKQHLCSLDFIVSPASFMQTNPAQAEVLYGMVLKAADLQPTDTVLDLFCGAGAISLVLAQHCHSVTGVESNAAAVADAKRNAALNGISNASFWCHDLGSFQAVGTVFAQRPDVDVVVADPARAGMGSHLLQLLQDCQARRIVYVSCNPHTQARDVQELCKQGRYVVQAVQPCDMFPHTAHVECIVTLQLQTAQRA